MSEDFWRFPKVTPQPKRIGLDLEIQSLVTNLGVTTLHYLRLCRQEQVRKV